MLPVKARLLFSRTAIKFATTYKAQQRRSLEPGWDPPYTSHGVTIRKILDFCTHAEINGEKIFSLFVSAEEDNDLHSAQASALLSGICVGITGFFLSSCFVSHRQRYKLETTNQEDDLPNFFKAWHLLHKSHDTLSTPEKQIVTRFICFVLHMHNNFMHLSPDGSHFAPDRILYDIPTIPELNIFEQIRYTARKYIFGTPMIPWVSNQEANIKLAEYTGTRTLEYGDDLGNRMAINQWLNLVHHRDVILKLFSESEPLFILMKINRKMTGYDNAISWHAAGLFKDDRNKITFFDINQGIFDVKLDSPEHLVSFAQKYFCADIIRSGKKVDPVELWLNNTVFLIGRSKPKVKQKLVVAW
jgi:hypothetical protein